MEKFKVSFEANNQQLKSIGTKHASDTYADIEATFVLGEKWTDMDTVSAVWWNDFVRVATVLDSQSKCIVPHEVLTRKGCVRVNLVGSIVEGDELITRLTSYSAEAVQVNEKIKLTGSETSEITPSQFEQFVAVVISEVEKVTGMTAQAETLPAGSQATARYENGILYLGIPQGIQGERGETGADGADGNGIASVVYNADYSLTLVFDNGERFTTPPIRGERGPAGADGRDGTNGRDGADGVTPNLSVGNVTTLEPSQDAYVTRRGTDANPIFDFGIPKGDKGDDGTVPDLDLILPTDTASGDIASITDGQSVVPVKSLKVTLEPIQSGSGTPSPDNVRPISGHTEVDTEVRGKNLLDPQTIVEGAFINPSGQEVTHASKAHSGIIKVKPSTSYCLNGFGGISYYSILALDADKNPLPNWYGGASKSAPFVTTLPTTAQYVVLNFNIDQLDTIAFYESTTVDGYIAYNGNTYTTTLGRTVYGGTIDVVTGTLTVDKVFAQLDSETVYNTAGAARVGGHWAVSITNVPNVSKAIKGNSSVISSVSPPDMIYSSGAVTGFCKSLADYPIIILMDEDSGLDGSATAQQINSAVNSWVHEHTPQLVYELATPQTIQLTPQEVQLLLGTNNIWSDGDVTLTYNADIQKWVEKKLQS